MENLHIKNYPHHHSIFLIRVVTHPKKTTCRTLEMASILYWVRVYGDYDSDIFLSVKSDGCEKWTWNVHRETMTRLKSILSIGSPWCSVTRQSLLFFTTISKKNGNGKYLLLFLLWVFWMKTTVTRPSLLKSSTVEKYASSDSKWVADSRGDSPKRKIKKFKNLHERNYIESNYEWGMPKVMANLKNGTFSNYIQEIKKNMKNL